MNPHSALEKSVNWLLNNSLQAGVLGLLVLLVQWIFRRQLTSRWRFTLWWVVIVRLLLPFGPESAVSVFNFFRPAIALAGPRKYAPVQPAAPAEKTVTQISPGPSARVENSLPSPRSRERRRLASLIHFNTPAGHQRSQERSPDML